jgi:hypothetical protein
MRQAATYFFLASIFFLFSAARLTAQVEPGKRQTIDITSSFKPVLRNAAKLNFNATVPLRDSSRPVLDYAVPAQNLLPGLQPVALNPLAMVTDTGSQWNNSSFVKAGFGNLSTPFLQAGLSLGNEQTHFNVFADYISSNGKIKYQDYAKTNLKGQLIKKLSDNLEGQGAIGIRQHTYYQYGYDQALYTFEKSDLRRRYSAVTAEAGVRNLNPTDYGLTYQPKINLAFFNDNKRNNETNAILDIPLTKKIGQPFGLELGFKADLTRYQPDTADAIRNNLYTVPVALVVNTPNLKLKAGLTPSWDNNSFHLLPNFLVDFPVAQEKWIIQAGWISYYNKGTYQNFSTVNPYMAPPVDLRNTRMVERYAGFKGVLFQKFTYNAKIGGVVFHQAPLFVNDQTSGKSFEIIYEEKLEAVQIQAELGFIRGEDFSIQAGFNWYSFNKQETEDRAWGMIPLELKGRLRWKVMKDLWLTSDLFMWDGPLYKKKNGADDRLNGSIDLNAGLEFRISPRLFLWTQFNNITNSKYQRWNQYESYGFNMLGGVRYVF